MNRDRTHIYFHLFRYLRACGHCLALNPRFRDPEYCDPRYLPPKVLTEFPETPTMWLPIRTTSNRTSMHINSHLDRLPLITFETASHSCMSHPTL